MKLIIGCIIYMVAISFLSIIVFPDLEMSQEKDIVLCILSLPCAFLIMEQFEKKRMGGN